MTRKEFFLKLFAENDLALASVLILLERFADVEQLQRGREYIESRMKELYEEMPENDIKSVFPNCHQIQKDGADNDR